MKMTFEHYKELKRVITPFLPRITENTATQRWEIFRLSEFGQLKTLEGSPYSYNNLQVLYEYLNETHIDTALKQIVKEHLSCITE